MKCIARGASNDGFTLVEVMVALALVLVFAAGLYGAGFMVLRMTHFNRVSMEARALGTQMIEEIASRGLADIAMQAPFPVLTNQLQYGESVVRSVTVTGHSANHAVVSNLTQSAYMELHVNVIYNSPMTRTRVTNTFSTLVP